MIWLGQALGWIECLAFVALLVFLVARILVTGRFPRLPWIDDDKPGDE